MVRDIERGALVSRTVRCGARRLSRRSMRLSRITRPLSAVIFNKDR